MGSNAFRKEVFKKVHRVVLKLGSYVLTTPSWKLDRKVFSDITSTIAEARRRGVEFIIVSSGAVASGMGKLGLKERPRDISHEQAAAAIGQISLMGFYEKLFSKFGMNVGQILLTHGDLRDRKRFLNARLTINSILDYGAVPVINENDSIVVDEIKFGDNDYLSSLVTNLAQADMFIILTDIDGFYDKDPRLHPDARFISLVETIGPEIENYALSSRSKVGKGGMITKITAAKTAASFGIPTIIADGKTPGNLSKIIEGENIGTLIMPKKNKLTSRKHWIAYTLKPHGQIVVDEGARAAVTEKRRSLLPSGVLSVRGRFDAGEAVSCCDAGGAEFARGLTSYSSEDIDLIKGLKSASIQETLGHFSQKEIINRDDLVVLKEV